MTQQATTDWSTTFFEEDLRGLALILDYANEQARKLALPETIDLILRASRSLDVRQAGDLPNARERIEMSDDGDLIARVAPEGDICAWQAPEFLGGPIVVDERP